MNTILSLNIFLTLFYLANSEPPLVVKIVAAVGKCKTENNIEDKAFNDMVMKMEIPDTENFKCMMACFMREVGQYHDNQFDEKVFEKFNKLKWRNKNQLKLAKDINDVCFQEVIQDQNNECEMAYNLLKCFIREAEKVGLPLTFSGKTPLL